MNVDQACAVFLTCAEGKESHVYPDSSGYPTIGVGHLLTRGELKSKRIVINGASVDWTKGLTEKQVEDLLIQDLRPAATAVSDYVTVPLTQSQFNALVSFCFNVGVSNFKSSTLLKLLNKGDYNSVPNQLKRWNRSKGKVIPGLINRRTAEIELWNTPKRKEA